MAISNLGTGLGSVKGSTSSSSTGSVGSPMSKGDSVYNPYDFKALLDANPDYVVTIKYRSFNGTSSNVVTLVGLLMTDNFSFGNEGSPNDSAANFIEEAQRGLILGGTAGTIMGMFGSKKSAGDAAESAFGTASDINELRKKVIGGLKNVSETAKVRTSYNTPKFQIRLYIDPYSSHAVSGVSSVSDSYGQVMRALHGLVCPVFLTDSVAMAASGLASGATVGGVPLASPLMFPEVVDGWKDWFMGNYIYNHFDHKLISLSIGNWLSVPGGLWCTAMGAMVPATVNSEGKPITMNEVNLTFEYHRAASSDEVISWYKTGSRNSGTWDTTSSANEQAYEALKNELDKKTAGFIKKFGILDNNATK
ncbi:hypothetical protein C3I27_03395 [Campylobacter jejuni]|uniref:Uncharacterized protein n=2 Tax=Campylobacter jejuni TaxID=197 RepID=A0AAX1Z5L1_CAMJU|nr:hypothetical protein C3I27_03395 [Campylobacter jejuni]